MKTFNFKFLQSALIRLTGLILILTCTSNSQDSDVSSFYQDDEFNKKEETTTRRFVEVTTTPVDISYEDTIRIGDPLPVKNYIQLNNGQRMPPIGIGTYPGAKISEMVGNALKVGYRMIDTAFILQNEEDIGKCVNRFMKKYGVDRKEIFIISKLWNTQHRAQAVIQSMNTILANMKLDYLDMYLIHWPFAFKTRYDLYELNGEEDDISLEETWKAMEDLLEKNLTRSIGVANFNVEQLDRIMRLGKIKPAVNQIEVNPYNVPFRLIEYCQRHNITVMASNPIYGGSGFIAKKFNLNMFKDPIITEIAKNHERDSSQIVLRYVQQLGTVPLPKTDNIAELKSDLETLQFNLTDREINDMRSLNRNLRIIKYYSAQGFKEYPFN